MTCHRSNQEWHSYVKRDLPELEMREMTTHLTGCATCRETVSAIKTLADFLGPHRAIPCLPAEIQLNVMAAIDRTKYKKVKQRFVMRNWGFSLIAAGLLLLFVNPSPLVTTFAKLNESVSWQIARPVDQMGLLTRTALGKIEILYEVQLNKQRTINKEGLQ